MDLMEYHHFQTKIVNGHGGNMKINFKTTHS